MKKEKRMGYFVAEEQDFKDGAYFNLVTYGDQEIECSISTKKDLKKRYKFMKYGDEYGNGGRFPKAQMYELIIRKVEA